MKNIFLVIFILSIFWSCDFRPIEKPEKGDTYGTSLITLKVNGISHEFIKYNEGCAKYARMGIAHWPDCKFCKDSIN